MKPSLAARLRWFVNGLLERFRDPRAYIEDWEAGIYCDANGRKIAATGVYKDRSGLLRYRGSPPPPQRKT